MVWKHFSIKDLYLNIKDVNKKNLQAGKFAKQYQLNCTKSLEVKVNSETFKKPTVKNRFFPPH